MVTAETTGGNLSNPEAVLKPLVDMYLRMRDNYFESAREQTSPELREMLDRKYPEPWWRLMPITLPPHQSQHELSLMYVFDAVILAKEPLA